MATIDIRRNHSIGKDKARAAAQTVADKLRDKIDVKSRWEGDVLKFDRSGASGSITVSDTEVRVQIELGFLLKPMKGKIEEKVNQYMSDALGA